jgi:hypothetical protein
VRRGALVVLLALAGAFVLASCGGDESEVGETTTGAPRDPGREVMTAFVAAAARGDAEGMWALLSEPSRRRAGPTLDAFAQGEALKLRKQLAPYAAGKLPVIVSENIDGRFGVVALARGPHAYAVPLRLEGSFWRVELPGPLKIEISGPPPGSRGKFVGQIGVEVQGRGPEGPAVLYADGITLDSRLFSGPRSATLFANFASPLEPGRHTATAYASRGDNAAATAWTFVSD